MAKAARKSEDDITSQEDNTPPTEAIEIELPGEPDGSTEVELAAEPSKPEPDKKLEPESPLQAQVEATRRAEELQRANADLQRQIAERDTSLKTERSRGDDAEYNSVLTAIAAEQAVLDKAEQDFATFSQAGDFQSAAKVQRVIGSTAARLDRLEDGKVAFEQRRAEPKPEPAAPQAAPLDFEQQIAKMPDSAKSWLRKHPEFVNDTRLNNKIAATHSYLVSNKEIEAFSPKYFEALDQEFGFKEPEPQPQPQRRSMPVSAPVSRDAPSATGRAQPSTSVTLSQEERIIARTSFTAPNMTNEQKERLYAKNKLLLKQRRANGEYPQPERN